MSNTKKLSSGQSWVLQQMKEHGYLLVWNKAHSYFSFEKNGRDVVKHVSTNTAKSLINKQLLEENTDTEVRTTYRLSELGKTIEL